MIQIERRVAQDFLALLRRSTDGPPRLANAVPVLLRHGKNGLRLHACLPEVALFYANPVCPGDGTLAIPASALEQVEGKTADLVKLEPLNARRARAEWTEKGQPRSAELPALEPDRVPEPPPWPKDFAPLPASFPAAFHEACRTTPKDATRYALQRVQLRGKAGQVVGTDTRQLLVHGGLTFPFPQDLLVPRCGVFGTQPFKEGKGLLIGRTDSHVVVRSGPWAVMLRIDSQGRFPDVISVVPRHGEPETTLRLHPADADLFLAGLARKLRGAWASGQPLTLDLGPTSALRFKTDQGVLETPLTRSEALGEATRLCVDLKHFLRALELRCTRFECWGEGKPVIAREGERLFVMMTQATTLTLPPQLQKEESVRTSLPVPAASHKPELIMPATVVLPQPIPDGSFDVLAEAEGFAGAVARAAEHAGRLLRFLRGSCGQPKLVSVVRNSLLALTDSRQEERRP
jgi:hypothetical protein